MSDQQQVRALCAAQSDQLWAGLKHRRQEISRIAWNGPDDSDFDRELVKMIFHMVSAELITRAYDLKRAEEPTQ